jgi:hypothetical protein
MKTWMTLAAMLLLIVGAGITWIVLENRSIDRRVAAVRINPDLGLSQPSHDPTAASTATENSNTTQPLPAVDEPHRAAPSAMPAKSNPRAAPLAAAGTKRTAAPTPVPTAPAQGLLIPKPLARAALGFVGADPEAETVWGLAINDPDRSPSERKDLIEDLNEDGFPDPKHVTADDLPLILSRLELIEEFAPDSMDEVNAAAFAEAYKDLVNMLIKLGVQ